MNKKLSNLNFLNNVLIIKTQIYFFVFSLSSLLIDRRNRFSAFKLSESGIFYAAVVLMAAIASMRELCCTVGRCMVQLRHRGDTCMAQMDHILVLFQMHDDKVLYLCPIEQARGIANQVKICLFWIMPNTLALHIYVCMQA